MSWIEELRSIGLGPDDALFPSGSVFAMPAAQLHQPRSTIEPMMTSLAVTEAFRSASLNCALEYTPHSARHCLVALGDLLCRTAEQKKAWSKNLGHFSVVVAQVHYAKVTEDRKREIFDGFNAEVLLTDDEKDLMLDYYDHRIPPDDPEYLRARALVAMRTQEN